MITFVEPWYLAALATAAATSPRGMAGRPGLPAWEQADAVARAMVRLHPDATQQDVKAATLFAAFNGPQRQTTVAAELRGRQVDPAVIDLVLERGPRLVAAIVDAFRPQPGEWWVTADSGTGLRRIVECVACGELGGGWLLAEGAPPLPLTALTPLYQLERP